MNQIEFSAPPLIGTVVSLDDQVFELRGKRPHVRKDGSRTTLLDWESTCPKCGTDFTVTTGLVCKAINRRCGQCKTPGKPVKGKRGRKVKVEVVAA